MGNPAYKQTNKQTNKHTEVIAISRFLRDNYKGTQGNLTGFVQIKSLFLQDLRGRQKQTVQKKANFRVTKKMAYFFSYYRG